MSDFIIITRFETSPSKRKNKINTHVTIQNGTPNFISLSPFRYKEYSNNGKTDSNLSSQSLSKQKIQINNQNDNLNDFSLKPPKDSLDSLNKNENIGQSHSLCDELIDNSIKNNLASNQIENNQEPTQKIQSTKKKKDRNSLKKKFKIKLTRVLTPTRRSHTVQTSMHVSHDHNPSENDQIKEHHVVNTFKNISKSKEKVFDNAQKIRYKKAIQNYDKIENYNDRMIEFETEKIIARFSPTKNTEFASTQMANPILTSTQRSQRQIKYYYPPSHINNTSKIKSFIGLINYDRGITEAVAEVRRDKLKADFMFEY